MKIDLHTHTKTGSDGNLSVDDVFQEARKRNINFMSITDHDSVDCQERAIVLAKQYDISYITGVELNVTFQYPGSKSVSLDFLGYQYDLTDQGLTDQLKLLREYRKARSRQIFEKLNVEFNKENIARFTGEDIKKIQDSVDGAFGRSHIANYLIEKGVVGDKQEAFDKYLVKCDVPKYPLLLADASRLIRNAGGILVHAHPNDPRGTSLTSLTRDLNEQTEIIKQHMLEYIDGIECWHSRHEAKVVAHYIDFARKHRLIMTGGSDCHQKPILLGTLDIPDYVAEQFRR
jgi:hypothetical protein